MKLDKGLCFMCLFAVLALKGHNSCLFNFEKLANSSCWLCNSYIVYERKTKDYAGSRTFQHKSWHLCFLL